MVGCGFLSVIDDKRNETYNLIYSLPIVEGVTIPTGFIR